MVIFSCDGCNDVLKKSQVDAHAGRCRKCYAVSCVDCLVSFPGGKILSGQFVVVTTMQQQSPKLRGSFAADAKRWRTTYRIDRHVLPWELIENCFN
jgi:hypothetical protein